MNHPKLPLLLGLALLGACANGAPPSENPADLYEAALPGKKAARNEAMLLVSLDDGTVIMQTIESPASVCFKLNSETSTTCLLQGAALVDPATDAVIGYEMIEEKIELIARTD